MKERIPNFEGTLSPRVAPLCAMKWLIGREEHRDGDECSRLQPINYDVAIAMEILDILNYMLEIQIDGTLTSHQQLLFDSIQTWLYDELGTDQYNVGQLTPKALIQALTEKLSKYVDDLAQPVEGVSWQPLPPPGPEPFIPTFQVDTTRGSADEGVA